MPFPASGLSFIASLTKYLRRSREIVAGEV
jgi:hypothetical protein